MQPNTSSPVAAQIVALQMADRIAHRGPDDTAAWVDEVTGIALAYRLCLFSLFLLQGISRLLPSGGTSEPRKKSGKSSVGCVDVSGVVRE